MRKEKYMKCDYTLFSLKMPTVRFIKLNKLGIQKLV